MSEVVGELADAIKEVGLPNPEVLEPFHAKWDKYRIEGMATEPMEWQAQKLWDSGQVDCYCACSYAKEAAEVVKSWIDDAALLDEISTAGLPPYCKLEEPSAVGEGRLVARWDMRSFSIYDMGDGQPYGETRYLCKLAQGPSTTMQSRYSKEEAFALIKDWMTEEAK